MLGLGKKNKEENSLPEVKPNLASEFAAVVESAIEENSNGNGLNLLTRDQILAADDLKSKIVPVPEWGGSVRVKALTGEERDKYEGSLYTQNRNGKKLEINLSINNIKARLAAYSIIDEKGSRLFGEGDIVRLGKKSAAALNRVADVCQELSGITEEDLEELTKNSEATTSEDSPSA